MSWRDWPPFLVAAWIVMSILFGILFHNTVDVIYRWVTKRKDGE